MELCLQKNGRNCACSRYKWNFACSRMEGTVLAVGTSGTLLAVGWEELCLQ